VAALRFLLDEDLPPAVAATARDLGLDVVSVHEVGRTGYSDEQQLAYSTATQRIFVTRNRDDFIELTRRAFATNQPHAGVLLVPGGIAPPGIASIARAIDRWAQRYAVGSPGVGFVDFLPLPDRPVS
jgi:predicted nuclease of predicted toxin-antitoxin system